MKYYFLRFIAFGLICIASARGEEPVSAAWRPDGVSMVAYVTPTRATVGDKILYTVGLTVPEEATVSWPPIAQRLGDFRVRDLGQQTSEKIEDGRRKISRLYELRLYETGARYIPSMTVVLRNENGKTAEIETGEIAVNVVSVLDKAAKDIKDIKPPLSLTYFPASFFFWFGLGCAAIAAAAVWLLRRRTRKIVHEPPPPPHVKAYEELRRILAMDLIAKGKTKEFYIRISDVVRRYIERRFKLRAPDMTTEEFLEEARASGMLDPRARTLVGDFLEQCDMVKFAKYGPTDGEIDGAYRSAKRFVDETKLVDSS